MLRLLVARGLFRLVRATLAAGVVLALGIALLHSQFAGAEHALSGSGLSTLGHRVPCNTRLGPSRARGSAAQSSRVRGA